MNIPTPAEIKAELARRSLQDYIKLLWPGYRTAPHIDLLCEKLEAVERGELHRLIICMPPRHSKSVHVSEYFPAWYMGKNPSRQVITATYSGEFSAGWGGKVKAHIQDPLSVQVFPDLELKADTKSKTHFETTKRGEYSAVGIGGAATGRGADLFIIDDPIKNRQDAESETIRETCISWYKSVALTRLMPEASVIVMMTRWHELDLVGHLLKNSVENWEILELPGLAEEGDILCRAEGDALWPDQYPAEELEKKKLELGSYEFNALYQQKPAPPEGSLFNIKHFNRYDAIPEFPLAVIHSYDTGTKVNERNDPTSLGVWHVYPHGFYLVEQIRTKIDHPQRKRLVVNMAARDNPLIILIEDEGNGTSLIQDLRSDNATNHLNIAAITTKGKSKEIRALAVTGLIESGRVYLPNTATWLADFEHELKHFPNGRNDDQVDQMTQALDYMKRNKLGPGSITYESKLDDIWSKMPEAGAL